MTENSAGHHVAAKPDVTMAELKCLLAILKLSEAEGCAATNRIARELQVKPPTVCRMLDKLLSAHLITKVPYGKIELTLQGKRAANRLSNRITMLQSVIVHQLHLNAESALHTALFIFCNIDEDSQKQMISFSRDSMKGINQREVVV